MNKIIVVIAAFVFTQTRLLAGDEKNIVDDG